MSPMHTRRMCSTRGFPRVSGDEPHPDEVMNALFEFSPRERG